MEQDNFSLTPPELRDVANKTINHVLPEKSRKIGFLMDHNAGYARRQRNNTFEYYQPLKNKKSVS